MTGIEIIRYLSLSVAEMSDELAVDPRQAAQLRFIIGSPVYM